MSAEFGAISQVLQPGASVVFTLSPSGNNSNFIYHRDGSGLFRLASPSLISNRRTRRCCCKGMPLANYIVSFHGNIQVPTGGTAGTISLGLYSDSELDPESVMQATVAAVEEPQNVGTGVVISVPWICRCASISVRNLSDQAITLNNGAIIIGDPSIFR